MTTLVEVRNRIKSALFLNDNVYDADIDDCIRQAITLKDTDRWWFLERVGSVTLDSNASSVALPANYGVVANIDAIQYGNRTRLAEMTYALMTQYFYTEIEPAIGTLEAWASLGRVLHFSHRAQEDTPLQIRYFERDVALPQNGSDTSLWFGREGYDVIRKQAMYMFQVEYMKDAAASQEPALIAFNALKLKNSQAKEY